jgi:hypothetical protein
MFLGCGSGLQASVVMEQPEWHSIDAGLSCASARVGCDAIRCIAKVRNRCGTPVTCRLTMNALCQAQTGETGPATGGSGPQTVLSAREGSVVAEVICDASEARLTRPDTLRCFR